MLAMLKIDREGRAFVTPLGQRTRKEKRHRRRQDGGEGRKKKGNGLEKNREVIFQREKIAQGCQS